MNLRDVIPTAENSSNYDVVPESITEVGTTLENLKAAAYAARPASANAPPCAPLPPNRASTRSPRLFRYSAAEQIRIGLGAGADRRDQAGRAPPLLGEHRHRPEPRRRCLGEIRFRHVPKLHQGHLPAREGNKKPVRVMLRQALRSRARQLYMDAYNNAQHFDEAYYLATCVCATSTRRRLRSAPSAHPGRQVPQVLVNPHRHASCGIFTGGVLSAAIWVLLAVAGASGGHEDGLCKRAFSQGRPRFFSAGNVRYWVSFGGESENMRARISVRRERSSTG